MVKTRNAAPSTSKDKGKAIIVAPPESSDNSHHSDSDLAEETTPLARTHGIPFLVFNDSEVAAYKRLATRTMPNPRAIEWATMKALHIDEQVRSYLKVLNLEKYANRDNFTAFRTLTLECFSTIEMHDNGNYLTCRLDEKEVKITDKVLCDIYGLKTTGARKKPEDFQTYRHCASFSPCKSFNKAEPSAGLIKELPIAEKYLRTIQAEVSSHNARVEAYITKNDERWDQWEETHAKHEAHWDHWEKQHPPPRRAALPRAAVRSSATPCRSASRHGEVFCRAVSSASRHGEVLCRAAVEPRAAITSFAGVLVTGELNLQEKIRKSGSRNDNREGSGRV
ncbi:chromatin assembly factor 1 subunit B [Striga asiatica]|uniref:Chromatin assembly factor 1 subunit B n=1 Tax=Striga asiatica TaxID=4170 RepID=A0A5A7P4L0_STRAF|nr:chromatin assembly factor 1 subunit B [Striga asiatica]